MIDMNTFQDNIFLFVVKIKWSFISSDCIIRLLQVLKNLAMKFVCWRKVISYGQEPW